MDDLIKTMKAQLYDRVSSPLIFTFILSWSLWNYKLILILLSGLPANDKLFQIEMLPLYLSPLKIGRYDIDPWWNYWVRFGFLGPVITTLVYLYVLPFFEAAAFELTQKKVAVLKKIKLKAEDDVPIGQEESRTLRQAIRDSQKLLDTAIEEQARLFKKEKAALESKLESLQIKYDANEEQFRQDIARCREEISNLENQKNNEIKLRKDADRKLAPLMFLEEGARHLFNKISDNPNMSANEIRKLEPSSENDRWLTQLFEIGLIDETGRTVKLTNLGERLHLERTLNSSR
jgi:hypothetical protein